MECVDIKIGILEQSPSSMMPSVDRLDVSVFAKVHAPLSLPSPRAGESEAGEQRGERDQG
jgi:hypothetical protein